MKELLRERFLGNRYKSVWFAVLGDLNDEPFSDPVKPSVENAGLTNVLDQIPDEGDRWTHWHRSETTSPNSTTSSSPRLSTAPRQGSSHESSGARSASRASSPTSAQDPKD